MKHKFMAAGGQLRQRLIDLVDLHSVKPVNTPERVTGGKGTFPAARSPNQSVRTSQQPLAQLWCEKAWRAKPDPAGKVARQYFQQFRVHSRMRVQMMVHIHKSARQTGTAKFGPLGRHFPPQQRPRRWPQPNRQARPRGRIAPRPDRDGQRLRMAQMQMPADVQRRVVPGQGDGGGGAGLPQHQARAS